MKSLNIVNKKSHEQKKNTVINSKNENIESLNISINQSPTKKSQANIAQAP